MKKQLKRRLHIAVGVRDVAISIKDYTRRLGRKPEVVMPGAYALWRTASVNFSIRHDPRYAGQLRHLGFEDAGAKKFTKEKDPNGIVWERFTARQQRQEIESLWGSIIEKGFLTKES